MLGSPKTVLGSLYRADHKQFFSDAFAIFKHCFCEPYFESENVAEVGFAFENWVSLYPRDDRSPLPVSTLPTRLTIPPFPPPFP